MYGFLKGEETFEIVERDDGYIQALPVSGYFSNYQDWSPSHKKAMRYVRGRVLDIGCGAGRHSLYLQRKGFDVLGIDVSPYAIKTCKLRGLKKARVLSVTQVGPGLGIFDTLLMMGNNFGLFGNFKRARWLLRRFHKITSEKGRIIAEARDPYKTKAQQEEEQNAWTAADTCTLQEIRNALV
jgi:SAM-dependent methyltransferase